MPVLTPITAILNADIQAFRASMAQAGGYANDWAMKITSSVASANAAYRRLEASSLALTAAQENLVKLQATGTATADELAAAEARVTAAEERLATAGESAALAQQRLLKSQADAALASRTAAAEQVTAADRIGGAVGRTLSAYARLGEGAAIAGVVVGYESLKMANEFDASMMRLHTQAGVPIAQIDALKSKVLDLAGSVGFSPNNLAEALFHIESAFESMPKSLASSGGAINVLKVAAQGAAVGHANLVDVTNALTAAMASNIPGVSNAAQTMGVLNAIVGVGDMNMQQLAKSFSTGAVANVKAYGATIQDVGATLAVFGDNNMRGSQAGTQLRMAVQAMEVPAAHSGDALKRLGMNSKTMADDLGKGGVLAAITDLHDRIAAAKIPASQLGPMMIEIFGKKAGAGIIELIGQYDRVISKYPEMAKGAKNFGDAWQKTGETAATKTEQLKGTVLALAVSIGEKLQPYYIKAVDAIMTAVKWLEKHQDVAKTLATVVGVVLGGAILAWVGGMIIAAGEVILVVGAIVTAVAAFKKWYDSSETVRNGVKMLGDAIRNHIWPAMKDAWNLIVSQLAPAFGRLQKAIQDNRPVIDDVTKFVKILLKAWLDFQIFQDTTLVKSIAAVVGWFGGKLIDSLTNVIKFAGKVRDAVQWIIDKFNTLKNMKNPLDSIGSSLSQMGGKISGFLGFADGGPVPGPRGAPRLAVVHGGEYVVSNDMMDGRTPAGISMAGGGGGGGVGSATYVQNVIYLDGQQLQPAFQRQTLRYGIRNGSNGLSLPAGR